jgi:ribosome maturation factor RimP
MLTTEQYTSVQTWVATAIAALPEVFVIEIKNLPNGKVEVFLDADNGISIGTCTLVARQLNKQLEENWPDLMYELEVSSAGLEHPLQSIRQYQKNIGRTLEVMLQNGTEKEGKLIAANEVSFEIEAKSTVHKHKKEIISIPYVDAKKVLVGVSFN